MFWLLESNGHILQHFILNFTEKNRNRWYPLWRPVCSQFFTQPAWEEDMSDRGSIQMSRESTQEMQAWGALLKRNTKRLCQINQHVKQLMQKEHPFAYEKNA